MLAQDQARAAQAQLDLSHTAIRAPFDGVVGNKTVAVGDYLQPGAQIMAVVPLDQVYVIANYKETQITDVRPGQKVSLAVDGFPDLKVTGEVDSIYPSSGQDFACCRPITRPAISPRSCSACRSKSCSTSPPSWSASSAPACRWNRKSIPGRER